MVVNYDKKNRWTTWLDSILDKAPKVSDEIKNVFDNLANEPDFDTFDSDRLIEYAKNLDVVDDNLTEFFKNDKYVEKTFANYQQYLKDTMGIAAKFKKAMSSVGTVFKKIGAAMVTEAVFMAASWAIGKIIKGIDEAIHRSEILIEKGKKAKENIRSITDEYNQKSSSVSGTGERFDELRVGVDQSTNENISLSNEEYQEYLNLCNKIADIYPELVTSYDSQGNAILDLGSDVQSATEKLKELLEVDQQIANLKIAENLQTAYEGTKEEASTIQEQINELVAEAEDAKTRAKGIENNNLKDELRNLLLGGQQLQFDRETYGTILPDIKKILNENGITYDLMSSGLKDLDGDGYDDTEILNLLNIPTAETVDKVLKDIENQLSIKLHDTSVALHEQSAENLFEAASRQKEIDGLWNDLASQYAVTLETNPNFNQLSEKIQAKMVEIVSGADFSTLPEDTDIEQYIKSTYLYPISEIFNSEDGIKAKNAINSLFDIDASGLEIYEYNDKIKSYLEPIKNFYTDILGKEAGLDKFNEFAFNYGFLDESGTKTVLDQKFDEIVNYYQVRGEDVSAKLSKLDASQIFAFNELINDTDFSGTFQEGVNKAIQNAQSTIDNAQKITFASLLSAEDGDTRKAVDKFEEEAAAIQSAMEKLSSEGRLSNSDWIELQKTLPELAGSTEDLDKALSDLKADKAVKFAEEFGKSIAELSGDKEALQSAVNYFADQIKTLDLPAEDLSLVQDWLVRSITSTSLKDTSGLSKMITEALLMDFDEYLDISFNTAYETYTSKMATFTDALEQFKAGTLEGDALTELYQKVPELAQTTDDLDVALTKLAMNEIGVMLADLNQQIENCIEAGGDVEPLYKLREAIADAVDPSNYTIEELKDQLYAIPEEARDSMSRDDLELAFKLQLETGQAYSDFDKLTQDIETRKVKLSLEMDNMSMFDDYEEALNGLENGDRWDKYGEILKSAKESYDAGDWGEKQFKEAAKLYSYANDSGAANFAENYERFKDFFQEDTKAGAVSFLNFLDEYDYAHFDDALNTWIVDIKDFAQAAKDMEMPLDLLTAGIGNLQDKGFDFAYVADYTDGISKIEETKKLLAEAYAEGDASEIARLEQILDLTTRITAQEKIKAQLEGKDMGIDTGITTQGNQVLDSEGNVVRNLAASGIEGATEAAEKYNSVLGKVNENMNLADETQLGLISTLGSYSSAQLKSIDLMDGQYGEYEDAEKALDALQEAYGLTAEEMTTFINVLSDMGLLGEGSEKAQKEAQEMAKAAEAEANAVQNANQILAESGSETRLGDTDIKSMSSREASERASELEESKKVLIEYGADTSALDAEMERTELQKTIMVDIESTPGKDVDSIRQEIDSMSDEEIELRFHASREEVESALDEIESSDLNLHPVFSIDEKQFNQLIQAKEKSTVPVDGDTTQFTQKVDEAIANAESKTATVTVRGNTNPLRDDVTSRVSWIEGLDPTINVSANTQGISSAISNALLGPFSINVSANVHGLPSSSGGGGGQLNPISGGGATGTIFAHATGTAYNMLNLRPVSGAYASGTDVSLNHDQTAVVNELQQESLIFNRVNVKSI